MLYYTFKKCVFVITIRCIDLPLCDTKLSTDYVSVHCPKAVLFARDVVIMSVSGNVEM